MKEQKKINHILQSGDKAKEIKHFNDGFLKVNDIFYLSKFQNSLNSLWKSNFTKKYE